MLQNEDIPLNWGFRFSFATDIARAMAYMHSKRMYHGRLTSSNCIIDDRWTVKICGKFNLHTSVAIGDHDVRLVKSPVNGWVV